MEKVINSETVSSISQAMKNTYLLELFVRITQSPECGKFLKFLFNKIMYPTSTTAIPSTILDKLGEESIYESEKESKSPNSSVSTMSFASKSTSSGKENSSKVKQHLAAYGKDIFTLIHGEKFKLVPKLV